LLREDLEALLGPLVADLGYELWELEYMPAARGGLLRIYIDAPAGVTLEDCERVSRAVSKALDAADPIPGHYTLEVSSPGLDRPLRTPAHFARFVGGRIRVQLKEPIDGRRRYVGQLSGIEDDVLDLAVEGGHVRLPLDSIQRARLEPQY
jgi:ribosome maturation factor RimP